MITTRAVPALLLTTSASPSQRHPSRTLPRPCLPGHGVEVVEGDLLPVDIQPAYDGQSGPPPAPGGAQAPHTRMAYESIVTRLS
jgi:hypothetical protein